MELLSKETSTAVKHPGGHQIVCVFNEQTGYIQILDHGWVTTLVVPAGHYKVEYHRVESCAKQHGEKGALKNE